MSRENARQPLINRQKINHFSLHCPSMLLFKCGTKNKLCKLYLPVRRKLTTTKKSVASSDHSKNNTTSTRGVDAQAEVASAVFFITPFHLSNFVCL